jgi:hypothetical protein
MTNIASSMGCVVLALALAACTRDRSLGSVDAADGRDEGQETPDAADAPGDIPVDVPVDTPVDRFDGQVEAVCIDNRVTYHVGDVIPRGDTSCPISCLCLEGGVIGACTGACPTSNLCLTTNGQVSTGLCCANVGDFPDSCAVGACGCSPANSHSVSTCVCPAGGCFLQPYGCVGPAGVCTVGADQTCNDNPTINSLHGQCLAGGHCTCNFGPLTASGKCP